MGQPREAAGQREVEQPAVCQGQMQARRRGGEEEAEQVRGSRIGGALEFEHAGRVPVLKGAQQHGGARIRGVGESGGTSPACVGRSRPAWWKANAT